MKSIKNNVLVIIAFLLSGTFQIDAQEHSLTEEERQAKLDSIIAETERHFGWNDDAYSVKTAKEKWLSGDAKLLLQGGIVHVVYIGQEKFAKRYGVDYDDFGCIANCSDAQMAKYNTVIMDCLTAKFGKGWRDSIRKDVPGLDKYCTTVFKNIRYEGNGTATVVLPVIYKALGRSASDPEESRFVLDIINCVSPTSMDFLYRGVEYYIPLSYNTESGETPSENELIEITVRVFNPKVFRYSKNIKPYPFCVIEAINLLR